MYKTIIFCTDYLRSDRGGEIWLNYICKYNNDHVEVLCLDGPIARNGKTIKFRMIWYNLLLVFINCIPGIIRRKFLKLHSEDEIRSFILICMSICYLFINRNKYKNMVIFGPKLVWYIARFIMPDSLKYIAIGQSGWVQYYKSMADCFVAITPQMANEAKQYFTNVETIPNGVDLQKFHANDIECRYSNRILCVAALSEDKNLNLLLDAILQSKNLTLDIYGKGPLEKKLLKHPAFKQGRATLSNVSYENIPSVYRRYNTCVLPSLNEAFGLVLIEAYASGCNLVVDDNSNMRSFLPCDTIFCDCSNASSLQIALEASLDIVDQKDSTYRQKFLSNYDWHAIGKRYANLLRDNIGD
jgi:glycosyltransferase involved in cell wall biosynthesis